MKAVLRGILRRTALKSGERMWGTMELSEKIIRLRTQRSWSQKDLAAAMEEPYQSVVLWESGQRLPELDRLIHLSQIFEVPLEELVGELGEIYDLTGRQDPGNLRRKVRKDRLLLVLKLLGAALAVLLAVIVNMVWVKFLTRFGAS